MKGLILTLALVCLASIASAQMVMPPSQVLADRVTIGAQFIPRCPAGPNVLIVAANQTVTMTNGAVLDCVEVAGTLKASRTQDTTFAVTTLIVLPGGVLDVGTAASPIPSTVHVHLSLRSVAIDTTRDPFQWGNGLASFGTVLLFAPYKTPGCDLSADAFVMNTAVTLACVPQGWQVGDTLLFADTVSPLALEQRSIVSLTGSTVVLSAPLAFAHRTVTAIDGRVAARPKIFNLTRTITIDSENPLGVPGHVAFIGNTACWTVQGAAFVGLGRTTTAVLDSTSADLTHIGTNQIARYALHFHHVTMACPTPRQAVDNVLVSKGPGKWGLVIHGTHDTLNQENIETGFPGAGLSIEDGYEIRNQVIRNYAVGNLAKNANISARVNLAEGRPGTEGTGIWAHGIMNVFDGNESWNNTFGLNLFDFHGTPGSFPSVPGGMPDTPYVTPFTNDGPFLSMTNTLSVGNVYNGLETWELKDKGMTGLVENLPIIDHYVGINNGHGLHMNQAEFQSMLWLRNPVIVGSFQAGTGTPTPLIEIYYGGACVSFETGYVAPVKITGGYLSGCASALYGVPNTDYIVTDTTLQGAVGVFFDTDFAGAVANGLHTLFTNVSFLLYGQHPPRYVVNLNTVIYDGTGTFPLGGSAPPPPPPPLVITWTTLAGLFQQQQQDATKFRLCPDSTGVNCVAFVKP